MVAKIDREGSKVQELKKRSLNTIGGNAEAIGGDVGGDHRPAAAAAALVADVPQRGTLGPGGSTVERFGQIFHFFGRGYFDGNWRIGDVDDSFWRW